MACAVVTAATPSFVTAGGDAGEMPVVMTRNIYIGADIFRVVEADPILIVPTIADVYQTVVDTNFTERAEVLADEIFNYQPHLIGLQEVSLLLRQSPGDVFLGNPVPATDVDMDYLEELLAALAARGLSYTVGAEVRNADIELPLITDTSLDDIRLVDRDVILVREDVPFANVATANFSDNVVINLSGAIINFNRGWTALDATIGGETYRFVNTHLEVGSQPDIQSLQAVELIGLLENESRPIILVGDFNASAEDPPNQAYAPLVAAGYVEIWPNRSVDDNDPGYTCCHEETLMNPVSLLDERIDLVFARRGSTTFIEYVEATVVGNNSGMLTASGLWPSDHGGVVASFRFLGAADDADGDGVTDGADNCLGVFNPNQRDTDADDYGNLCDGDFNQDGIVNFLDLAYLRLNFLTGDPTADLNGDGVVNAGDLGIFRTLMFEPPGPSGLLVP